LGRNYYLYFAILLTIAITIGSLIPIENSIVTQVKVSDKFVHTFAYCLLTLSWLFTYKLKIKKFRISLIILAVIFSYGIIIEILQEVLTDYRQADFFDMLANLVGILIASILFKLIFQRN